MLERQIHKIILTENLTEFQNKSQTDETEILISYRFCWSEWRDSNPRPLHPQCSALPGCATLRRLPIIHYRQTGTQAELGQHHLCLEN